MSTDESLGELWRGADKLLETKRDSGVRDTGVLLVEYKEEPGQERVQGLFDQVAGQIYQLVDQKRQHKQYIDSLSLADVTQARTAKRGEYRLVRVCVCVLIAMTRVSQKVREISCTGSSWVLCPTSAALWLS